MIRNFIAIKVQLGEVYINWQIQFIWIAVQSFLKSYYWCFVAL